MSLPHSRCRLTGFQAHALPKLLRLLAVVVVAGGLASCKSSPGKERSPAVELDRDFGVMAEEGPGESSAAAGNNELLYFKVPHSLPDAAESTGPQPQHPSERMSAALLPPLSAETFDNSELLAVLKRRLAEKWNNLDPAGENEESSNREPVEPRRKASVEIIALSFLGESVDADTDLTRQALEAATSESADETQRLIAQAYATHFGTARESGDALTHLAHSTLKKGQDNEEAGTSPAVAPAPFKIDRLSFAESISGPGNFTPLEEAVAPGREVLVYGEFRNFHSVKEIDQNQEVFYRRAFEATLSLFSEVGEEIDGLEFLPRKRGRQLTASRSELMNFWALYRIPAHLRAGRYKIAVNAQDLIGSSSASAELWFELRQAALDH